MRTTLETLDGSAPDSSTGRGGAVPGGIPRSVDFLLASVLLLLALPALALAAIAIALTSPGPILFRQQRVGRRGKLFVLLKLRTMRVAQPGLQVTAKDDPRTTPVGRFLRKAKIDELPQLVNVIRGDMSLVGPRPEVPTYVDLADPLWKRVLSVRPGVTDPSTLRMLDEEKVLAAVAGDRDLYYRNHLIPLKLRECAEYLKRRTWRSDLATLLQTGLDLPVLSWPERESPEDTDAAAGLGTSERDPGAAPPSRAGRVMHAVVRLFQFLCDGVVLATAFLAAYLLRFDFQVPDREADRALRQILAVVLIQFAVLAAAGVYRFIWRYVGLREARTILLACAGAGLPFLALRFLLPDTAAAWRVPVSVILTDAILAFLGILGLRLARRSLFEYREKRFGSSGSIGTVRNRALLIGAGRAGVLAAREIFAKDDMGLEVQGFVDDDPAKAGAQIHGFRVLGTTADLPRLVKELEINQLVITIARITRPKILRIIDICRKMPVKLLIVPGLYEILQGKVQTTRIRIVDVEDLLAREPVQLDEEQIGIFLAGKVVMVTGAGGSIGSELARQVARVKPSRLLLVERSEAALFQIEQDVLRIFPGVPVTPLLVDIGDEQKVHSMFATFHPQVVIHAAAHKHVPLMESHPEEAVQNNLLATKLLGETAGQYGVESFVLISTDKAVRPTSVMGATKRMAEIVVQDLAYRYAGRFVAVRFGNVIGSAGSVVPIFREQIKRGGPVTVTHPEMRRYFMTVREAAQLVLQAGAMGEGGEIFVLDMGEPHRILDLATTMITLTGLKPYEDMEIVFTGLRPGEKLFEELSTTGEDIAKTRHPKIFIGRLESYAPEQVNLALSRLAKLARDGEAEMIRRFLNEFVSEATLSVGVSVREEIPQLGLPGPDWATPVI